MLFDHLKSINIEQWSADIYYTTLKCYEDVQMVAPPQPQGAKITTFINTSEETSWLGREMRAMNLIKLSIHAVLGLGGSVWVQKRTGNFVNAVER